jgi:hypothetical protein
MISIGKRKMGKWDSSVKCTNGANKAVADDAPVNVFSPKPGAPTIAHQLDKAMKHHRLGNGQQQE